MSKTNFKSEYAMKVQQAILVSLQKGPKNIKQLSNALKLPYPTVRLNLRELEYDHQVMPTNLARRGVTYKVATGEAVRHKIMPTVNIGGEYYKVNAILNIRNQEEVAAAKAIKNLPMHITRLLKAAERLHSGDKGAAITLERIRHEMRVDRNAIQNAFDLFDQVLKHGKMWNAELLAMLPDDSDWNQADLDSAYEQYFPQG